MQGFEFTEDDKDFDFFDSLTPRNRTEIREAIAKLEDQIRYNRDVARSEGNNIGREISNPEMRALAPKVVGIWLEQMRVKYDVKSGELGSFNDLEVAEMKGKLSALAWVLGYDWRTPYT
jgi:hypothetical protein